MTESSQATSAATEPAPAVATTPPPESTTTSTTPPATSLLDPATATTEAAKTEPPKEGTKPNAKGAPETYADFKAPEGFTLDKAVAAEAGTLFKSLGLTQDQAQSLVDFYGKQAVESQDQSLKSFRETRDGWVAEAKKSFGKDIEPGGKVVVGVGRMLDSLGDAKLANEFKAVMNLTGAGDHPAFIGVMSKLVERLGEGTPVPGGKPSPLGQTAPGTGGRKSAAQEMYPTLPSGA